MGEQIETRRVGHRATKLNATRHASIVNDVAAGLPVKTAAMRAGIAERTAWVWLTTGADTLENLKTPGWHPSPYEQRCVRFLQDIHRARAHAQARSIALIAKAARDPHRKTTTKVKTEREAYIDEHGQERWRMVEVERTTTEEQLPPDWRAEAWLTERRWPEEFGRIVPVSRSIELPTVFIGADVDDSAGEIALAEAISQRLEAGVQRAIPATSTVKDPEG